MCLRARGHEGRDVPPAPQALCCAFVAPRRTRLSRPAPAARATPAAARRDGGRASTIPTTRRTHFDSMRSLLHAYSEAYRRVPYRAAFATCLVKGAIADGVAQIQVEKRDRLDARRTMLFALWSAAYCGSCQHYIFNRAPAKSNSRRVHPIVIYLHWLARLLSYFSLVCRSLQPSLWRCHGCCGCIAESLCRLVCGHAAPWDTNLLRLQATHRGWPMAAVVRPAPVRSDLQRLLLQAGDGLGACASSHVLGRSAALAHRVDCNSKLRVALLRQLHCEPPPRGASARAVMRDAGGAQRTALAHAHSHRTQRLMMSCVRHDHVRHDQLPLAPVCGWPRCGCQGRARGIAV